MTTLSQLQRALDAEAGKLSKAWRGRHVFEGIRAADHNGANWTASLDCIASACPMDDTREALERVQAKFRLVEF